MDILENRVILKPDSNRKKISCEIEQNSLNPSKYRANDKNVLLVVPAYTRIERPLELIRENLRKESEIRPAYRTSGSLDADEKLIDVLEKNGVTRLKEMKRAGLPMGLLRVGTAAKREGYNVQIIDAVFEGWNNDKFYFKASNGSEIYHYGLDDADLERKIREANPAVIGISIDYTHQWGNARRVADIAKSVDSGVPVIMGGAHATGLPADILLDSPTDYVVLRQGDITFTKLLDVLTGKSTKKLEDLEGIAFKKDGQVIKTKDRKFIKDIELIGTPDYSFLNLPTYSGPYHSGGERKVKDGNIVYGFTTLGCNTRCTFCTIPRVQGPWIRMNNDLLEKHLQNITSLGVKEYIVEDDHLLHDPAWAMEVFDLLKKYKLPWFEEGGIGLYSLIALLENVDEKTLSDNRHNKIIYEHVLKAKQNGLTTKQLIRSMAQSGCYSVYLAVESANADSLSTANKPKVNAMQSHTQEVVGLFDKNNINATVGLMLGFVNPIGDGEFIETRSQINNSIKYGQFLKGSGAAFVNPFIFTPLPGAPHFSRLEKYATKNTDEGYSHEFCTVNMRNNEWSMDEMNLLRVRALVEGNGLSNYMETLRTGTWAVRNKINQ